jgi:hypothetical protein
MDPLFLLFINLPTPQKKILYFFFYNSKSFIYNSIVNSHLTLQPILLVLDLKTTNLKHDSASAKPVINQGLSKVGLLDKV